MQFDHLKRREFIALLGGAATWPFAARAQQARVPTIGWLGGATPATQNQWAVAFTQLLRQLGWSEGTSITIEYRWAEGRPERFAEIAAEFVRLKVDVILAAGTEAALAAKQATAIIPIVFPVAGDPVGTGLVASLTRPGANLTGVSNQSRDLAAKRLELLSEVSVALRSSSTRITPLACWKWARFTRRRARLASNSSHLKSGAARISRPRSRRSAAAPRPFM